MTELMKKENIMKKAYKVRINEDEGYDVVVFAETPAKAKTIAMGCVGYDDWLKYKDLRPSRFPQADKFVLEYPKITQLSFDNQEHARFLRNEEWYMAESSCCENCGLGVFDNVPESHLDDNFLCEKCRNEVKK